MIEVAIERRLRYPGMSCDNLDGYARSFTSLEQLRGSRDDLFARRMIAAARGRYGDHAVDDSSEILPARPLPPGLGVAIPLDPVTVVASTDAFRYLVCH